ncbi:MAG TPA: cell division protein FtsA [Ktedonobacterales bacterium]|jgi:cell division protein FtsA
MTERTLVGIDVGTSKIAALMGVVDADGVPTVVAGASAPARGMRQGVVVDIEEVTGALRETLERLEQLSGRAVTTAVLALGGQHVAAANTTGSVALTPGGREVRHDDVARAMAVARAAAPLGENRELICQIPRAYRLDDQEGVANPIGMAGFQLEVETHVVTASQTITQHLIKCAQAARADPEDLVSAPLATATAVLSPAEREMGTLMLDIGAGTTGVALYAAGAPWYSAALPGGGETITYAIAAGLRVPLEVAERLKLEHGHCDPPSLAEDDLLPLDDERIVLPQSELATVIQAQVSELLAAARAPLRAAQAEGVRPIGVVLTGGTAALPGLTTLAERTLGLPARIGTPQGLRGLGEDWAGPAAATVAGLLLWSAHHTEGMRTPAGGRKRHAPGGPLGTQVRRALRVLLP